MAWWEPKQSQIRPSFRLRECCLRRHSRKWKCLYLEIHTVQKRRLFLYTYNKRPHTRIQHVISKWNVTRECHFAHASVVLDMSDEVCVLINRQYIYIKQ